MILTHPYHQRLIATICTSSGMYLLSLTNLHSVPSSHTFPSTPTLQACSTRFNKGTKYLANTAFSMATKPDLAMYYHRAVFLPSPEYIYYSNQQQKFLHIARPYSRADRKSPYKKPLQQEEVMSSLPGKTSGQPALKIQLQTSQLPLIYPKQQSLRPKLSTLLWSNQVIF